MSGFGLQVNDVMTAVAYALLERPLFAVLPGNIVAGVRTIAIVDRAIYAGAKIIVGTVGVNQEIVTISSITANDFTATFAQGHNTGEVVKGATFPGGQTLQSATANVAAGATTAPLFTQAEVLQYFQDVQNDFLERTRVIYNLATHIFSAKSGPISPVSNLPSDCIRMERVDIVGGAALWPMSSPEIDIGGNGNPAQPVGWYLDRQNTGQFAVDPPPTATTTIEMLYSQKTVNAVSVLTDALLVPDLVWLYLKYGILASAFSKEGEMRDARRAAYCTKRYERGVQYTANYMKQMKMSPGFGKGQ